MAIAMPLAALVRVGVRGSRVLRLGPGPASHPLSTTLTLSLKSSAVLGVCKGLGKGLESIPHTFSCESVLGPEKHRL